ncbi:MAG TPA: hypothetical protein DDW23_00385 [Planctomycetes bacterium]|nr:hypothetical protein [Planctomycetota bacterium]
MTPKEALPILEAHSPPGETWPNHCRQVAKVAKALALASQEAGVNINPLRVEAHALLHDIGRSKTHGPMHGWSGYILLKKLGKPELGRGCITHWTKGRTAAEMARNSSFSTSFIQKVYAALDPPDWNIEDSILSIADSSVMHTTIVSLKTRHTDLESRYGKSDWITRTKDLAFSQESSLSKVLGRPVEDIVKPLHGHSLDDA